jgi:hypothetical protein
VDDADADDAAGANSATVTISPPLKLLTTPLRMKMDLAANPSITALTIWLLFPWKKPSSLTPPILRTRNAQILGTVVIAAIAAIVGTCDGTAATGNPAATIGVTDANPVNSPPLENTAIIRAPAPPA